MERLYLFGYVKADKPDLKVCEYDSYKAVYCSLCRQMAKDYGPLAKFSLSYDLVFLALIRIGLQDKGCSLCKRRCRFNPLKKCAMLCDADDGLKFTAGVAVMLTYFKLLDDVSDSSFFKVLFCRLLCFLYKPAYKKAKRFYPEAAEIIENAMAEQEKTEWSGLRNIDRAADPTASSLGKLFSLYIEDESSKRVLYRLGYCVGKWVYVTDAADDLSDDLKNGSFNPLLPADCDISADDSVKIKELKEKAEPILNTCICEAALAFELIEFRRFSPIIGNIIYRGLENVQNKIIFKNENKKVEKEGKSSNL